MFIREIQSPLGDGNYSLFKTLKYFSFLSFFKMIFAIGLTSFMLAIIIGLISSFNVIKNNSLKILKEK